MDAIANWIVELNGSNHVGFGLLTVGTMAGIGVAIAAIAEVVFTALGIRADKIEIHH